jgi:thiol-disulfide isomerase/thioredoxin
MKIPLVLQRLSLLRFFAGALALAALAAAKPDAHAVSRCGIEWTAVRAGFETDAPVAPLAVGDDAPDFAFTDLADKPHRLSEFRGKTILLDFWATWCGPCIEEIPTLRDIHASTKSAQSTEGRNFVILSISMDATLGAVKKYVSKNNMPWQHGHAPGVAKSEASKKYNVRSVPSVWLIGPDGKIKARDLGGNDAKNAVRLFLEGQFVVEPRVTVSGIVVDEAGKPVAGAKVRIYARRKTDPAKGIAEQILDSFFLTTDANGVWTYDKMFLGATNVSVSGYHYDYANELTKNTYWGKNRTVANGLLAEDLVLERDYSKDDSSFSPIGVKKFYANKSKIVLYEGVRVYGVVKNSQGKPLAGVPVFTANDTCRPTIPLKKTDEKGEFYHTVSKPNQKQEHLKNQLKIGLGAFQKGYAPEWKLLSFDEIKSKIELVLKPPQTIRGIAVGEDGKPLNDVWVQLRVWRGTSTLFEYEPVRTGKDGRFEFKDMPDDVVELSFWKENVISSVNIPVKAGAENKIVLIKTQK